MIRVLHYGLSMNTGGIETYLYKLWKHIDKEMFHFDFIDTNLGTPCFYDEFVEMGSQFYKVTPRNISIKKNKEDLQKLFETESFDIVHCHLNTLSYIEPIKIALKYGCEVIVHSRSSNSPKALTTKILHYYNYIKITQLDNQLTKLAVSRKAGNWLFGENTTFNIINNGIDLNKFKFKNSVRNNMRDELDLNDKFVIGHVGAFLYAKNHKFILEIFKSSLEYNEHSILMLVGDGPLILKIKAMAEEMKISDKILFMGIRSDIPDLMASMDVFIFPSFYEGFPNVILEAQATGLPCLISDKITDEIIINKNCEVCSLNSSSKMWVSRMYSVDRIPERERAYKLIQECGFSIGEQINTIEKVYTNIYNKR